MDEPASSAHINWAKSNPILLGSWQRSDPPLLPENYNGFKMLGVFFRYEQYMLRNWEGVRRRCKAADRNGTASFLDNNLVASKLWHMLICLDTPLGLLDKFRGMLTIF